MADNQYELKNVAVRLVSQPSFLSDEKIETPQAAVRVLAKEFADYDREVLSVVNLNVKGKPINASIVSMGILDGSLAHPREILKTSILSNAAQILLLHNHPSNVLTPSRYDIAITDRMQKACELIGIPLADHIIIGRDNYFSFRQNEILPLDKVTYAERIEDIQFSASKVAENGKTSILEKMKEKQKTVEGNNREKSVRTKEMQSAL